MQIGTESLDDVRGHVFAQVLHAAVEVARHAPPDLGSSFAKLTVCPVIHKSLRVRTLISMITNGYHDCITSPVPGGVAAY